MAAEDLKTVLKKCILFCDVDDNGLDIVIHHGKIKPFSQGETIYKKGEDARDLFCVIISGRVGIIAETGQIVRGMGSSEVIGDIGVTSPQHKRTLSVRAVKPTEIIEWNVNALKSIVPDLMKKLKNLAWKNISNYMDGE